MNRREILSLIILVVVVSFAAYKYYTRSFTETKSQYLMDTVVEISATSQNKNVGKQIDAVFAYIKNLEDKLNEYSGTSWLSKVNNSQQTTFDMDPDVYAMLVIADSLYNLTHGAFDPTIKPVWDLWGFNSESPTPPDSFEIKAELAKVGFDKIVFDKHKLVKPSDMQITLGALAKGYILDKAYDFMQSKGLKSGYISCRSSIRFFGLSVPQIVYVQHPRKSEDHIASFKIDNQSIGTSGDYQQFYEIDGIRYHHIINAITGYPVPKVYSVTVQSPLAVWADGLSTALFLLPPDEAIEVSKHFTDTNALIYYDRDGEIVSLKSMGFMDSELAEKL